MSFSHDVSRYLPSQAKRRKRVISSFETAPAFLFYFPVAVWWGLLSLRYRSPTLPTLANPAIEAGGLCGESKSDVLGLLGRGGRRIMAKFLVAGLDPWISCNEESRKLTERMAEAGIDFPVVAKPDIGRNGRGVRKISDIDALSRYLVGFPRDTRLMLQEFSPFRGEAGIFYVRPPGRKKGKITSITLKFFPSVTGDGYSTLKELILANPRAGKVPQFYLPRLSAQLERILPEGEVFPLVFTGNHCQGAIFRDGTQHATAALTDRIDAIAKEIDGFYFGRFDMRYDTLEALEKGEGFTIIELNGAGSEATHIWDADMTLFGAYRVLFSQVHTAFRIGAKVRKSQGLRPMSPLRLLQLYFGELADMRQYPSQTEGRRN